MVKGKLKDDRHVDRDEDGEDKDKIMFEVRTQNQNLLKAAISRKEKVYCSFFYHSYVKNYKKIYV